FVESLLPIGATLSPREGTWHLVACPSASPVGLPHASLGFCRFGRIESHADARGPPFDSSDRALWRLARMSDKVTIELPVELSRRARAMAAAGHRRLEDAVVEWVRRAVAEPEVDALPDDEVLRLCDAALEPDDQEELSGLLGDSREGRLDATGQARLDEL